MVSSAKHKFDNVQYRKFATYSNCLENTDALSHISIDFDPPFNIVLKNADQVFSSICVKNLEFCQLNDNNVSLRPSNATSAFCLEFDSPLETSRFMEVISDLRANSETRSIFEMRTDESSASQYFQFYGYLAQQQNMMQDYIRTSTYQRAMLANLSDFKDKIILDVGAGSGILSFFALQAGAKRVYAVEASTMAMHCEALVKHNKCQDRIIVLPGKIEEVNMPEQVDTIISEPMGYMLLNERMLETYLHAKKFLKPNGKMYPTRGDLHIAPFTDEALFIEQGSKANFWCQEYFHGVNLTVLRDQALDEYFRQPIVDTFDIRICLSKSQLYPIDFLTSEEEQLHTIDIPLSFLIQETGYIHGLAFWFDVAFIGSNQTVWLSTSCTEPLTHWYQVRCLIPTPILARQGNMCTGRLILCANKRQSYDVHIELTCNGQTAKNDLDLKNPFFRYTGQMIPQPPGQHTTSPTEAYWNNYAVQSAGETLNSFSSMNLINGGIASNTQPTMVIATGSHHATTLDTHSQQQRQCMSMFNQAASGFAAGQNNLMMQNGNVNVGEMVGGSVTASPHQQQQHAPQLASHLMIGDYMVNNTSNSNVASTQNTVAGGVIHLK